MYKIELSRIAAKELEKIFRFDRSVYRRIVASLDALTKDPRAGKPLVGALKGLYSYRVGVYRVIYSIKHYCLVVDVIDIGHRREVYR